MGFSRVVDVKHYPSDVLWSIVIGIAMVVWLYFVVFNISKRESGELNKFEKGEEFRWSLLFVIVTVLFTIAIISFRYIFIDIIYYQPIYVVFCSILGYFLIRRMKKLMSVLNT